MDDLKREIMLLCESLTGDVSLHIRIGDEEIGYQSNVPLIAASLIKVPCAYALLMLSQEGDVDLDELIVVTDREKIGGTGVLVHMPGDVHLTYRQLVSLMITVSDNTATNVIIDQVGIPYIQEVVDRSGCEGTKIQRKIMHTNPNEQPLKNVMSAKDMNRFLMLIDQGTELEEGNKAFLLSCLTGQQLIHKLPYLFSDGLPPTAFVAHKTGDDIKMEHNGGIIKINNKTAYVTVMTDQLERNIDGQALIQQVGKQVYDYLNAP
ncbi:serine hydrolase [Alteribacter aurantiacus]|uniref:serine hydrolase n=1 Tax=Alteribacter aurantiacus TaxID=254410 RepID=UPI00040FA93E|nr:serine hydrolase [Alteribacter aurantiacus]